MKCVQVVVELNEFGDCVISSSITNAVLYGVTCFTYGFGYIYKFVDLG